MIRFENDEYTALLLCQMLNALGADTEKNHQPLSEQDVAKGLLALTQSAFNYGLIDLDDEQHLGLLYYWMLQVKRVQSAPESREAWWYNFREKCRKDTHTLHTAFSRDGFYRLAIIGAGSAAAYYVNALGEGYDHTNTVLVGAPDPWRPSEDKRSRGTGYINHEAHLIGQWGKKVPEFSTTYVDRGDFADGNAAIFERIPLAHRFTASVKKIFYGSEGWIRIEFEDGRLLRARKVVIASGAGPHASRGITPIPDKVMDLDEFMRKYPSSRTMRTKSIIVNGPNAGIDAVERAGECGFQNIIWFMSASSSPVFLPGNRLLHAPHVPPTKLMERDNFASITGAKKPESIVKITSVGGGLEVAYVPPDYADTGTVKVVNVDLYVYALGQDGNAEGAIGKILDQPLLKALVPIYDIQGRHATAQELSAYAEAVEQKTERPRIEENTILGFQVPGTTFEYGIEVIGAAANQMASAEQRKKMLRVVNTQPGTVVTADQLGTVKGAIGAQNAVMPRYVTREMNLNTDDRTVLRMHIAAKYPNINEPQAQRIIEMILEGRRTTDKDMTHGYHPLGYDAWWQRYFRQMLEYWNAPTSARPTVVKKHELENKTPLNGRPGFQTA